MAIASVVEAAPAVMAAIDGGLVWVGDGAVVVVCLDRRMWRERNWG